MAVKGFKFWYTYYDVAQDLTPKQQGEFYRAIMTFMFEDIDPEDDLKGAVRTCFKAIKPNIKTSKRNSVSGIAGNEVRWSCDKEEESQVKVKVQDKDKPQPQPGVLSHPDNPEPPVPTQMPQAVREELQRLRVVK